MEFHRFVTVYEELREAVGGKQDKPPSANDFYAMLMARFTSRRDIDPHTQRETVLKCLTESWWVAHKRPFYRVWPKVLKMFLALDLGKVIGGMIKMFARPTVIHFPVKEETIEREGVRVRSIMAVPNGFIEEKGTPSCITLNELTKSLSDRTRDVQPEGSLIEGLFMWVDHGEKGEYGQVHTYCFFPFRKDKTVGETFSAMPLRPGYYKGMTVPDGLMGDCVKLYCTLCLIDNKECDLIDRVVLNADRLKYEETGDSKYVAKAAKRGVVGWDVGRRIEVVPHFRRPHLMLAWTGKGRAVPKIVPRKGSLIHRDVVEKIPTGYAGPVE